MEITLKIDTSNPEARAFYEYSKTLSFVRSKEKKELSDKEVEEITKEMGEISNANMTARFLLNRFNRNNNKQLSTNQ